MLTMKVDLQKLTEVNKKENTQCSIISA